VTNKQAAFFNYFGPEAREILAELLEKYAVDGELQFTLPDVLKCGPFRSRQRERDREPFRRIEKLGTAVNQLQSLLYAA